MSDLNDALGRVIRGLREQRGVSQESLALECELHRTYVGQIERGLKSPTVRTLFVIAKGLGVAPSEILRRVEKEL